MNKAHDEVTSPGSYQITMATIFKTASFKLWQKLTKALPLGPILPSIIPKEVGAGGKKGFWVEIELRRGAVPPSYPWWLKK